jgi:hypothetical protein
MLAQSQPLEEVLRQQLKVDASLQTSQLFSEQCSTFNAALTASEYLPRQSQPSYVFYQYPTISGSLTVK